MDKLFTKFYQGADLTTRETQGTGLGLAISKQIVDHHKGKIWAKSKGLGLGSTFSFTLPFQSAARVKKKSVKKKKKLS